LRLTVTEDSAVSLASALARGDKPKVRIEGDVQLAAEVNWLIDHVRWDAEEDLARLIGDAPAHTLAQAAQQAMAALRSFVAKRPGTELRTGGPA
jgi:ubiquinone biosynthesis protein UbiJ